MNATIQSTQLDKELQTDDECNGDLKLTIYMRDKFGKWQDRSVTIPKNKRGQLAEIAMGTNLILFSGE